MYAAPSYRPRTMSAGNVVVRRNDDITASTSLSYATNDDITASCDNVIRVSTVVPLEIPDLPTPWARKEAKYRPLQPVKDIWRAKWRLSQQRPRDGIRNER